MKFYLTKSAEIFSEQLKFIEKLVDVQVIDTPENAVSLSVKTGDKLQVLRNGNNAEMLMQYVNRGTECIEELECPVLPYSAMNDGNVIQFNDWGNTATVNLLNNF